MPKGSILGPLLFNVYVNSISDVKLHSKIYQYADDAALVLAGKNVSEGAALLQEDINKLIAWFEDNHIYINKDKSQLICFHSPHRKVELPLPLYLHNNLCRNCKCASVNFSTKVKYLGLIFDETFSWTSHIEHLATRLRQVCASIYKIRSVCDGKLRKIIYKTLGESIYMG